MLERVRTPRPPVVVQGRERPAVRRRLTVGPADDSYEREADAVAAEVMSNLQRAPAIDVAERGPSRIRPHSGQFDPMTRRRMEHAFGADFDGVRVHTSATIDTAAEGLAADAFTLGRDVYVRRSLYRPGTPDGDRLLAHELTHTLQQGGSRIRRSATAGIDVHADMPADRVSRKKRMLYLDFVKMKRYDPKYGRMIKKALGMDVGDAGPGGSYGHWWTEIGTRDPDNGTFTTSESYGWWPEDGAGPGDALVGVDGKLNQDGGSHDPHEGETGEAGLTEFHPAMNVDTDAETYDQIKARVANGIDAFAHGYSGKWQWKLGWGQNCHTFQQAMKTKVKMHYQAAKGWLEDPAVKQAKQQAAASAAANLKLVAGKKMFTYTQKTMGTVDKNGDDDTALRLDDGAQFALTGAKAKYGAYYVQECVTSLGDRGWVPEVDLQAYSNM
jgi:Domain of unknown function (DUF4157)